MKLPGAIQQRVPCGRSPCLALTPLLISSPRLLATLCLVLAGCGAEPPAPDSPATAPAAPSLRRLDPAADGAGLWSFASTWRSADLPQTLPGARPPLHRWDFQQAPAARGLEGWSVVRQLSPLLPDAPAVPAGEARIGGSAADQALGFSPRGFSAASRIVRVSPRTRYLVRLRVQAPLAPEGVFRGLVLSSLNAEPEDLPDDPSLLWSRTELRTFQDQYLAGPATDGLEWESWSFELPPTMFGTRSLMLSLVAGLSVKGVLSEAPFRVASVELHEIPVRDSLNSRSSPPLELPDPQAVDAETRCALVRSDQDSRRAVLLTRGSTAECAFEADQYGRLETALCIVPEARLTRDGPAPPQWVRLSLHSSRGELDRHRIELHRFEDQPVSWTDAALDLPIAGGPLRLRVQVEGVDTPDAPLIALSLPRLVPRQRAPGLNLLMISFDTLRADRVGRRRPDGTPLTPNLDALAARSTVFEQAFSTSSYTLPAHVSMLTGQHVQRHGMLDPRRRLAPDAITLTQRCAGAGYRTAAFTAGAMLNPEFCGLHRGFDEYTEMDPMVSSIDPLPTKVPRWYSPEYNRAVFAAQRLEARALPWLAARDDAPFFCFLHTYLVHNYHPEPAFQQQLTRPRLAPSQLPEGAGPPLWQRREGRTGLTATSLTRIDPRDPAQWVDARDRPYLESLYDATVAQADAELGRILDTLREAGLEDQTIVVVCSDHGEEFLEHGGLAHARTLYDEVLRVPCIVHVPGRPAALVSAVMDLADLAPTLLDLLNLPPLPDATGESMARASADQDCGDGLTLHQGVVLHGGAAEQNSAQQLSAARRAGHKLIRTEPAQPPGSGVYTTAQREQLRQLGYLLPEDADPAEAGWHIEEGYDLGSDPDEQRPLPDPALRDSVELQALRQDLERREGHR